MSEPRPEPLWKARDVIIIGALLVGSFLVCAYYFAH